MTPSEAIEYCLKLDETNAKNWVYEGHTITDISGRHNYAFSYNRGHTQLIAEYRTLCPRLAKALRIAMEALKHYDTKEFDSRSDADHQLQWPAEQALTEIAKVFSNE